jgi:anti-anti-sigma factor
MSKKTPRQMKVNEVGGVTVVSLSDPQNVESMGQHLFALVERENRRQIVIDFANVKYFSETALGKLLGLQRLLVRTGGGRLTFCNLAPAIREMVAVSKLGGLFRICDTLEEAVAYLSGSRSDQTEQPPAERVLPGEEPLPYDYLRRLAERNPPPSSWFEEEEEKPF